MKISNPGRCLEKEVILPKNEIIITKTYIQLQVRDRDQ